MSYRDPRQTLSKKDCKCGECQKEIKANSPCMIDPKEKKAYHLACWKTINK